MSDGPSLGDDRIEWCVWNTATDELHRGPWGNDQDPREWIRGAVAAGIPEGKFVVKSRAMGAWRHVDG
jgi:hypothetical protein